MFRIFFRIERTGASKIVVNGYTYTDGPVIYETSANFLKFFSLTLLKRNPNTVLEIKDVIMVLYY